MIRQVYLCRVDFPINLYHATEHVGLLRAFRSIVGHRVPRRQWRAANTCGIK